MHQGRLRRECQQPFVDLSLFSSRKVLSDSDSSDDTPRYEQRSRQTTLDEALPVNRREILPDARVTCGRDLITLGWPARILEPGNGSPDSKLNFEAGTRPARPRTNGAISREPRSSRPTRATGTGTSEACALASDATLPELNQLIC